METGVAPGIDLAGNEDIEQSAVVLAGDLMPVADVMQVVMRAFMSSRPSMLASKSQPAA